MFALTKTIIILQVRKNIREIFVKVYFCEALRYRLQVHKNKTTLNISQLIVVLSSILSVSL